LDTFIGDHLESFGSRGRTSHFCREALQIGLGLGGGNHIFLGRHYEYVLVEEEEEITKESFHICGEFFQ
jgi:hypothetical protein